MDLVILSLLAWLDLRSRPVVPNIKEASASPAGPHDNRQHRRHYRTECLRPPHASNLEQGGTEGTDLEGEFTTRPGPIRHRLALCGVGVASAAAADSGGEDGELRNAALLLQCATVVKRRNSGVAAAGPRWGNHGHVWWKDECTGRCHGASWGVVTVLTERSNSRRWSGDGGSDRSPGRRQAESRDNGEGARALGDAGVSAAGLCETATRTAKHSSARQAGVVAHISWAAHQQVAAAGGVSALHEMPGGRQ